MANDEVRTLTSKLNNYWERGKTLEEINELLRPGNIALNVNGLVALLNKIDDIHIMGKRTKMEKFVERFTALVESLILTPPKTFEELYQRKDDGASTAMHYIETISGNVVQIVFDTQESKRLKLHAAYIELWRTLGHKPSYKEINASDLTLCSSTYSTNFGGIPAMLKKNGGLQ